MEGRKERMARGKDSSTWQNLVNFCERVCVDGKQKNNRQANLSQVECWFQNHVSNCAMVSVQKFETVTVWEIKKKQIKNIWEIVVGTVCECAVSCLEIQCCCFVQRLFCFSAIRKIVAPDLNAANPFGDCFQIYWCSKKNVGKKKSKKLRWIASAISTLPNLKIVWLSETLWIGSIAVLVFIKNLTSWKPLPRNLVEANLWDNNRNTIMRHNWQVWVDAYETASLTSKTSVFTVTNFTEHNNSLQVVNQKQKIIGVSFFCFCGSCYWFRIFWIFAGCCLVGWCWFFNPQSFFFQ